jgi:hypothetical protein
MTTIPTPLRPNFTAPTCSSSPPRASSRRSTPTASATAWEKPSTPPPASCGAPPMNGTPGQQPGSRLHHPRAGGRLLRLALVLHGRIQDPRQAGKHPELKGKVIVPDVLLNPHFASLELQFYEAAIPRPVSWPGLCRGAWFLEPGPARRLRSDHRAHGKQQGTGEYEDFLTGFVLPDGKVWGRPVGVAVAKDGSLLVSDDGSNTIWRVTYTGEEKRRGEPGILLGQLGGANKLVMPAFRE